MARPMLFEELLLIAYRDTKGSPEPGAGRHIDFALAGGVLSELALAGRMHVKLADPDRANPFDPYKDTFVIDDTTALGDPETDGVLSQMVEHPSGTVHYWMGSISAAENYPQYKSQLRQRLLARLAEQGVLNIVDHKAWGLFPVHRYPTANAAIETEIRARLDRLLHGTPPDPQTAALARLILESSGELVTAGFPKGEDTQRETNRLIDELRENLRRGEWGSEPQRATIGAIIAAYKTWTATGLG